MRVKWSAAHLRSYFVPGERKHDTHWLGGWVSLRAGLDTDVRRPNLCCLVCSYTQNCPSYHSSRISKYSQPILLICLQFFTCEENVLPQMNVRKQGYEIIWRESCNYPSRQCSINSLYFHNELFLLLEVVNFYICRWYDKKWRCEGTWEKTK
jgi:hypothetical protein